MAHGFSKALLPEVSQMSKIPARRNTYSTIDPTLDDFCYLMSVVIKIIHPGVNSEVAHDLLVEMVESGALNEAGAEEVGMFIRASVDIPHPKDLN